MNQKIEALKWLHVLDICESTNTWALNQLSELQHGDVVFTRHQTAGRGQFDRVWISPPGVLTASFVLELSIAQLSGLSLIAGLAVIHAVETLLPNLHGSLRLKWTNDVLSEGRKLAGVLCESRIRSDRAQVVVGIGLNCEAVPDSINSAISLRQISDQVPNEQTLLKQLRDCLLQDRAFADALPEIRARDAVLGKAIVFESAGEKLTGIGAGIDAEGRLLIRFADGIRAYRSGRVVSIKDPE